MGVPSFFRWLSKTYPEVILDAEPENKTDYLYIDFNALIHTASTPSDGPNQHTIPDIMKNLSKNIDRMVEICQPRKMLYLSIDGVAPRTKMMHQRSRRYRSAIEKEETNKPTQDTHTSKPKKSDVTVEESSIKNQDGGTTTLKDENPTMPFDSNAITPGTQFMYELEQSIQFFIEDRLLNHTNYKELAAIFSTSRKPGEGEQKIMGFIRKTKNRNLKHTIFSPDADLIFLGASLHGRSVKIMRENYAFVNEQRPHICTKCNKKGHLSSYCNNLVFNKFIYVDIDILRNVLEEKIQSNLLDSSNLEGNGGFSSRIRTANSSFNTNDFSNRKTPGNSRYFDRNNNSTRSNSEPPLIDKKGGLNDIFNSSKTQNRVKATDIYPNYSLNNMIDDWIFVSFLVGNDFLPTLQCFDIRFAAIEILFGFMIKNYQKTKKFITYKGKLQLDPLLNLFKIMSHREDYLYSEKSRKLSVTRRNFGYGSDFEKIDCDTARGRSYFYHKKLNITKRFEINRLCTDYIIGLSWVYDYYIQGIINWDWHFPYHYAPFLIDLANMSKEINDLLNALRDYKSLRSYPISCLEQQIFVLPPQSKHIAPKVMHDIFDSFPSKIEIDMFDKLLSWQGVVIVPMLDIDKLFQQIRGKKDELSHEEWSFFIESDDLLFVTEHSILFKNRKSKKKQTKKSPKGSISNENIADTGITVETSENSSEISIFDKIKGMYVQNISTIKHSDDFEMLLRPYHKYSMKNKRIVTCHIVV